MKCFGLTSLILMSLLVGQMSCAPNITTSVGVLKGSDGNSSTSNTPFHVYYGIPYAAAPVGNLRFRPPQAFTSDDASKVITSDTYRPSCPQVQTLGNVMHEDCLFLNVFTPSTGGADFDANAMKKVLVYIHGGAFQAGDATIYPFSSMSVDYDLVIVTIQYRIGPLGFLSSGTEALPGNLGLRDQIFALQWVQDNIAMFGGDKDAVTLMGESAGSTSVSLLSLSPLTKGLFSRTIQMSGSALSPWSIDMTYRQTFDRMAERANCLPDPCEEDCDSQVVECLRKLDAMEVVQLIARDAQVSEEDIFALDGYTSYAPVVDGDVLPRDSFDLIQDRDYLQSIGALDREYLIGVDNNEAMFFVLQSVWAKIVPLTDLLNPDSSAALKVIKNNLHSVFPYPANDATIALVKKMYFTPDAGSGMSNLQNVTNLMSDIDFVVPAILLLDHLLLASSNLKAYFFVFDLYPPIVAPNFPMTGSAHGFEMAYMCDETGPISMLLSYADVYAEECMPLIGIFRGLMANFIIKGEPTIDDAETWPVYNTAERNYMSVDETPAMQTNPFASRVSLWMKDIPDVIGMTTFLRGLGRAPIPDTPTASP